MGWIDMKLTGRTSHRKTLFEKIVVTVEEGGYAMWPHERFVRWGTRFRDARAVDMVTLELIKLDPSRAAKPDEPKTPPPPRR
jgi:phage pi2 protein 07